VGLAGVVRGVGYRRAGMRGVRVVAGVACALVALVALLLAWLQDAPDLTADDARTVTRRSLEGIGFEAVRVDPDPDRRPYEPATGPPVDAWRTTATVEGGLVELWVSVGDGTALFLLDRTADETDQLLTDEQFAELSEVRFTPSADRLLRRNLWVTAAAAAIVLTGVGLATLPAEGTTAALAARPARPLRPTQPSRPLRAEPRSHP
jgi:hypothetical protein